MPPQLAQRALAWSLARPLVFGILIGRLNVPIKAATHKPPPVTRRRAGSLRAHKPLVTDSGQHPEDAVRAVGIRSCAASQSGVRSPSTSTLRSMS